MTKLQERVKELVAELKTLAQPENVKGMARAGIKESHNLGVRIPELRALAKRTGRDHALALELWKTPLRETRILASMIDDLKKVTEEQMEAWVQDFDDWEVCDQTIQVLFGRAPLAWEKAVEWSHREEEFVKRAGFVTMARLGVTEKDPGKDAKLEKFFPIILEEAGDNRNFVKKAISWALRQLGKRKQSKGLHEKALRTARQLQRRESKAARWIANDVIKELTSEKILARFSAD